MARSDYTNAGYDRPHVPPATPPVIDAHADPSDAATLARPDGDSDAPGSRPAHLDRSAEDAVDFDHGNKEHLMSGGDKYNPGDQPDELPPGRTDTDQPSQTPDEVGPGQGDNDVPDSAPAEMPPPD